MIPCSYYNKEIEGGYNCLNESEFECVPSRTARQGPHTNKWDSGKKIIYRCREHKCKCCKEADVFEKLVIEGIERGIDERRCSKG